MPPPRPAGLVVAVVCLALVWPGVAIAMVQGSAESAAFTIFATCLWTLVWYFWLFRVWRGGPLALPLMAAAAIGIPAILLVGFVVLVTLLDGTPGPVQWMAVGAAILILVSGVLLCRRDVRGFSLAMVLAGESKVSSHNKGLFGCFMLVFAVVALIPVGVISSLAADDSAGQIALMVATGVVLVVGVAGYV